MSRVEFRSTFISLQLYLNRRINWNYGLIKQLFPTSLPSNHPPFIKLFKWVERNKTSMPWTAKITSAICVFICFLSHALIQRKLIFALQHQAPRGWTPIFPFPSQLFATSKVWTCRKLNSVSFGSKTVIFYASKQWFEKVKLISIINIS